MATTTTTSSTIPSSSGSSTFDLEQIITNDPAYHTYLDLFSCASLRIGEEDWNSLVSSDAKLAVQVGLLLLRNNKELEEMLEFTEKQYEEQKLRADHLENQVKNLNQLLKMQTDTYSSLEHQIEDLSRKYTVLLEDCSTYRKKNSTLWRRVEWLEKECEDYLEEITLLKDEKDNQPKFIFENVEKDTELDTDIYEDDEDVYLGTSSYSNTQPQKIVDENHFLKEKLLLYEEDNAKLFEEVEHLNKRLSNLNHFNSTKTSAEDQHHNKTNTTDSTKTVWFHSEENKDLHDVKVTPTVQHYHEIFAAIFERLKTVEKETVVCDKDTKSKDTSK